MLPHYHVSGTHAIVTALEIIALMGALKLLALSKPDARLSQAWLALF
jgi:hypothetical protein